MSLKEPLTVEMARLGDKAKSPDPPASSDRRSSEDKAKSPSASPPADPAAAPAVDPSASRAIDPSTSTAAGDGTTPTVRILLKVSGVAGIVVALLGMVWSIMHLMPNKEDQKGVAPPEPKGNLRFPHAKESTNEEEAFHADGPEAAGLKAEVDQGNDVPTPPVPSFTPPKQTSVDQGNDVPTPPVPSFTPPKQTSALWVSEVRKSANFEIHLTDDEIVLLRKASGGDATQAVKMYVAEEVQKSAKFTIHRTTDEMYSYMVESGGDADQAVEMYAAEEVQKSAKFTIHRTTDEMYSYMVESGGDADQAVEMYAAEEVQKSAKFTIHRTTDEIYSYMVESGGDAKGAVKIYVADKVHWQLQAKCLEAQQQYQVQNGRRYFIYDAKDDADSVSDAAQVKESMLVIDLKPPWTLFDDGRAACDRLEAELERMILEQ